ncbi:MAG TPA: hypothetical protein GXX48_03705, partial [Ochrobactrum intermedium]
MAIILDDNTDIDTFFGGNSGANSPAAKNREPSEKPREQELPSVDQKAARPPVDSTSSLELPGIQRPQPAQDNAAPSARVQPEQPAKDQPAPVPGMSARDWNDTINTMIAEAGGDGPVGMLAVANVIRNRAERRGKSIGDIVRAPSQFEGYYAPGEKAVQAQQNPQVRAEAEKILRGVLAGELKDPTQGADHFHAGGVNPDWASKMPATTRIGGHVFYNSQPGRNVAQAEQGTYEPGIEPRKYGYANGRGLANLVPEEKEPESGAVGSLSFVHQGQEKINPAFAAILTNVSGDIGRGLVINSGYRSPQHSVEKAKGNGGGEHTHGTAVDISMKGMSKQQRFELVQSLKARGVRRFITYTNSPDMLHVDLKEMPNSKDGFWYMHDKSARNFGKAPDWMQAAARTRIRHERLPAAQPIELDENFQASDPGNFYQGKNPFQAEIDEARASRQEQDAKDEPPAAAPGADIDARLEELNKEAPGRYAAMTEDEYPAWKQDFEANQPGQFMKGFKGALVDQNPTLLGNSLKALGVLFDNETIGGLGDSVREWGKSGSEKRAARVPSFSNIRTDSFSNFVSDATDYAAFSLGNGLGSMAPSVGAGVAGAAVSGGNPIVGFLAGAAGPSYVQNLGDIYGELIENDNIQARVKKGELTDKQLAGWAATGAVPMAALDMVSFGNLFNIATKDAIKQSIGKRIIKGIAEGSLTEGSTEAMQQVVSEGVQEALGADKSRSEQAIAIIDNFIGGALTGGAVGGVGGANPMRSKGSQSDPSAQTDAAPASDPQATSEGIPDAAPSPVTGMPEPEVEAPQRKGPLSKA